MKIFKKFLKLLVALALIAAIAIAAFTVGKSFGEADTPADNSGITEPSALNNLVTAGTNLSVSYF